MRKGDKREVTGIVVNEKLSLDRDKLRRFRALLHHISKTGLANKHWGKGNIISSITGYADYVAMVKPALGLKLKATLTALLQRPDIKEEARVIWTGAVTSPAATPPEPGKTPSDKPWWDVL